MSKGISRSRGDREHQATALVEYPDGNTLDVEESRYRERGYEPAFEDLPWTDDPSPFVGLEVHSGEQEPAEEPVEQLAIDERLP